MSCVSCRGRKLRCDREKPVCATCEKSDRECTYLERRNLAPRKRRRAKTVEARLAMLEARLGVGTDMMSASSKSSATVNESEDKSRGTYCHLKSLVDTSGLSFNGIDDHRTSTSSQTRDCSSPVEEDLNSQSIIYSRVSESLPQAEVQQELFQIYFDQIHNCIPIIHKQRFYSALKLSHDLRPPLFLQYSMWCLSSAVTPKYARLCEVFYQLAREYAKISEEKGIDEAFTVYHAQCWHLVATFEAQRMHITRSWMSAGKCVRLVQMMGLHRIDQKGSHIGIIPEAKGFIEQEERRRTFWAAYLSDRFASKCSGWPMAINEHEIHTNLPSSEYAFENGIEELGISLADALRNGGAASLSSPFPAVILATTLLGHVSMHIYNSKKPHASDTLEKCEFWIKHRELDTCILDVFIHLPDKFKLPLGASDANVVFLNMTLQTAAIFLHKTAMKAALRYKKDSDFVAKSMNRCITAADAITMATRHIDRNALAKVNLWSGFFLFMAGFVYCYDLRLSNSPNLQSQQNLIFLQQILGEIGEFLSISQYFKTQLEVEISAMKDNRRQDAGGGSQKQPKSVDFNEALSQPNGSQSRARSPEERHLSKVFCRLLEQDSDDSWVVEEDESDGPPHTNEGVPADKIYPQRLNSRAYTPPRNEQNCGLQAENLLPNQQDMCSINTHDTRNIKHNFTAPVEFQSWEGLTADHRWPWNSPTSTTQNNRMEKNYKARVHEMPSPKFDKKNDIPPKTFIGIAGDIPLQNETHGSQSVFFQGNRFGAFDPELWGV